MPPPIARPVNSQVMTLLTPHMDIRTVQDLLGHSSVETTQIYTHVMQKAGLGVRSSLDLLGAGPLDG
jgi:integrase